MLYEYNVDSVKITHMTVCCTWQAAERRRLGRSTAEQYHGRGRAARVSAGTRSSRTRTRTSATTCRRRRWPPPSTSVAIRIRGIRRVRGATRWIRTSAGSTAMCRSAASDAFFVSDQRTKTHTKTKLHCNPQLVSGTGAPAMFRKELWVWRGVKYLVVME